MPKKPANPNTWQGALLDSVEEVRLLVEQIATSSGSSSASATDWTDGTCSSCAHYNETVAATSGECRRFPPTIMNTSADGTITSAPPGVLAAFSCSEWRAVSLSP